MHRVVALALAMIVVVAGCAEPTTTGDADRTGRSTVAADGPETRPQILQLAARPTLAGRSFDGGAFDPNSVAGRDVLIWFWGPH